jgi:hypothetical protein
MGIAPKEVFNPLSGWVFNLKCFKKKENGITSYDNSEFIQLPNGKNIYTDKGDPVALRNEDVKKTYSLRDFQKPESFKSYDEMTTELKKICRGLFGIGEGTQTTKTETTKEEPAKAPEVNIPVGNIPVAEKSESLDDLLNSL